jgi:hypothetical protein
MPGGRRAHKLREYRRRLDRLLEEERVRRAPNPPPINEGHALLRRRIAAACREIELDPDTRHLHGGPVCTPAGARAALRAQTLLFEEAEYLERHGVDSRLYQ